MKFEIKHRITGNVMFTAEVGSLRLAMEAAVNRGAYLQGAYLQGADLRDAYLRGAYLRDADLRDAYLRGAYLQGADLQGVWGVNPNRVISLRSMYDQVGPIRMYKLVNSAGEGIYNGGLVYEMGRPLEVDDADCDEAVDCGRGINLADLPWCMSLWREGYRILLCEFTAADIAAIPTATDGKFRVHRCTVVGEKDLVELGLVELAGNVEKPDE